MIFFAGDEDEREDGTLAMRAADHDKNEARPQRSLAALLNDIKYLTNASKNARNMGRPCVKKMVAGGRLELPTSGL